MIWVEYSHNNSGGYDWLDQEDWDKLISRGWRKAGFQSVVKAFPTLEDGVREWTEIVQQDSDEPGCSCCGQPHRFYDFPLSQDVDWNEWEMFPRYKSDS